MILVLPMNPDLGRILNDCKMNDSDINNKLYCSIEYVLDRAESLLINAPNPHITDYIPINHFLEIRLTELIEILDLYALAVLNELVINNIVAPYLVNVNHQAIAISNKEEYT